MKRKLIRYFKSINFSLLSAESAILLRVSSLTKAEVRNFPLLHFPRWLCLVHGQLAMSLRRVKGYLCVRYSTMVSFILSATLSVTESTLEENQLSVNCYVSFLNFHSLKY